MGADTHYNSLRLKPTGLSDVSCVVQGVDVTSLET